jgi:hypothetical protein
MTIRVDCISVREAKQMSGLRIVLGAFAGPGLWHEACKGVYYVKGFDYTSVRSSVESGVRGLVSADADKSARAVWRRAVSSRRISTGDVCRLLAYPFCAFGGFE